MTNKFVKITIFIRLDARPKKVHRVLAKIHVDLPQLKTADVTEEKLVFALNKIIESLLVDGRVGVNLKESMKPPGILIEEDFLKESLKADFFKTYFRNRGFLKTIGIRRIRIGGNSWKRDQERG